MTIFNMRENSHKNFAQHTVQWSGSRNTCTSCTKVHKRLKPESVPTPRILEQVKWADASPHRTPNVELLKREERFSKKKKVRVNLDDIKQSTKTYIKL
uniref:Uncharacterized protein n=1 Tax=Romanomermis culicivorax TaxID=13658 RepID=A0A915L9T6_ROMCU